MVLYTIYRMWMKEDYRLHEIPVVKETTETYVLTGREPAAGYRTVVPKDNCPFSMTPEAAWKKFEKEVLNEIQSFELGLQELKKRLTCIPKNSHAA